ncbi:MAG: response regulator transcription factor [Anaerolineales bacterium]|jgi:DNA-binding response OmpR family regulator
MGERILVVEDEAGLREALAYNLKREGYGVTAVEDGTSAISSAQREIPDLVILDLMLPGIDGFEVCRTLRKQSNVPILMLTARTEEIDRVVGLEVGADDYLTKPFSMRELMARVKALLRRVRMMREETRGEGESAAPVLEFGELVIDTLRREVVLGGRVLAFKPREFDLLVFLARHRGQALSRELLLQRVWGWDFTGDSRTVDVHVRWLREKLEADPAHPSRLITVRGAGYRFEG